MIELVRIDKRNERTEEAPNKDALQEMARDGML